MTPTASPSFSRRLANRSVGVLLTLVFLVASCADSDGSPSITPLEGAEDPSSTLSGPNLTVVLGVIDDYFDAYNAGDDTAVLALLTADATLSDSFSDVIDWEADLAWNTGQGTTLTTPTCSPAVEQPEEGTVISCTYETLDALTQAVGSQPVPTTALFSVTSLGISDVYHSYGGGRSSVDFALVGEPFRDWLLANRPEVTCLPWFVDSSCAEPRSVEDERETGSMVAKYAQEWARYLETNNCTYLEGC